MATNGPSPADAATGDWSAAVSRRSARWPWPATIVFLVAAIFAGLLILIGALASGQIAFEAAKAGIQLLAVAILGGAVAAAYGWLEEWRAERRRIDAFRAAAITELQDTYHLAKSVRRRLRAAGFDDRDQRPDATVTAEASDLFRTWLEELDDARTGLEKLRTIVAASARVFGLSHLKIASRIREAEEYLGRVTKAWEKHSLDVKEGARLAEVSAFKHMKHFQAFLGSPDPPDGIKGLRKPIDDALTRIQGLLLGETV
jgi:hypothetical protein